MTKTRKNVCVPLPLTLSVQLCGVTGWDVGRALTIGAESTLPLLGILPF